MLKKGDFIVLFFLFISFVFWFLYSDLSLAGIGELLGIFAVALFTFSLVLATRLHFIEKLYDDLPLLYRRHAFYGQLALIFALLHPLFLLFRYSFSYFVSLPLNILFAVLSLLFFLIVIVFTLYIKLPYHIWLWMHRLLVFAYLFAFLHIIYTKSYLLYGDLLYLLYFFFVIGFLAIIYKAVEPFLFKKRYFVKDIKRHNSVIEILLEPKSEAIKAKEGQFVFLKFLQNDIPKETHPFSIAGLEKNTIRFCIKATGDFTKALYDKLEKGTEVLLSNAYGSFTSSFDKELWIAGGIGITPFLSFLKKAKDIVLIYAVRHKKDFIALKEIEKSNVKLIKHISSEKGRLSFNDVKKYVKDFKKRKILICGPEAMIKTFRKSFLKAGIKKDNIKYELFSFKSKLMSYITLFFIILFFAFLIFFVVFL